MYLGEYRYRKKEELNKDIDTSSLDKNKKDYFKALLNLEISALDNRYLSDDDRSYLESLSNMEERIDGNLYFYVMFYNVYKTSENTLKSIKDKLDDLVTIKGSGEDNDIRLFFNNDSYNSSFFRYHFESHSALFIAKIELNKDVRYKVREKLIEELMRKNISYTRKEKFNKLYEDLISRKDYLPDDIEKFNEVYNKEIDKFIEFCHIEDDDKLEIIHKSIDVEFSDFEQRDREIGGHTLVYKQKYFY